jgi:DNA-binding NtrC family response regulator
MYSQAKLLRVVEENTVEHLGGTKKIPVNRRILAATSKDIQAEIGNGTFRQDLFHRLDEVNIHLPPIKDRKEDIPLIANYFVDLFCETMKLEPKQISDSSMALLIRYDWHGNVRELRNVIKKAVLLAEGDKIWIEQLPIRFGVDSPAGQEWGAYQKKLVTLHELEKEYIGHVLRAANFNKKRAAEILGIDRTSLYNKINRYGIVIPSYIPYNAS